MKRAGRVVEDDEVEGEGKAAAEVLRLGFKGVEVGGRGAG
jgi:hypothetical protein